MSCKTRCSPPPRIRVVEAALFIALVLFGAAGCTSGPDDIVEGTGTVVYVPLEGGFYGIETAAGKYDPIDLPQELEQDGLCVTFKARVRDDMAGIHMWGQMIELIEVKPCDR